MSGKKSFDPEDVADGTEIISSHEMECQLVPLDYRLFFIMSEGEFYYRYNSLSRASEVSLFFFFFKLYK